MLSTVLKDQREKADMWERPWGEVEDDMMDRMPGWSEDFFQALLSEYSAVESLVGMTIEGIRHLEQHALQEQAELERQAAANQTLEV